MIKSVPVVDEQGRQVKPGDTIMYITVAHGDVSFNYAKVIRYEQRTRKYYGDHYVLVVDVLNTPPDVSRRRLTNPRMFKCGVELCIPTDTQITGT